MLSRPETVFFHPHIVIVSQGAGTDDDVLIEILASRTGEQIRDIVKVYKKGETKAHLTGVLLLLFVSKADIFLHSVYATMLNEHLNSIKSLNSSLTAAEKPVFSIFPGFNVSACCSDVEECSSWMRSEGQLHVHTAFQPSTSSFFISGIHLMKTIGPLASK